MESVVEKSEKYKLVDGETYYAEDPELREHRVKASAITRRFNNLPAEASREE